MGGDASSSSSRGDMVTASCRHRRRVRGALVRIAAVAVAALAVVAGNIGGVSAEAASSSSSAAAPVAAGTATATPTTTVPTNAGVTTTSSSSSASVGKYVLQRNSKSTDGNTVVEIVHMKDDDSNAQTMAQFSAITSVADWTLNTWEASATTLEANVKAATPTLTYMELSIQFQQAAAVQNLVFEHDSTWSFGPGLVLDTDALKGLSSLQTLKFTKFNVTFADTSWLPSPVTLSQLVFDQCTIPNFNVDTTATISDVVFRGSNLTQFPNFLLSMKTTLKNLTLENNNIVRPISMTSAELAQLKAIKTVVYSGNTLVSASSVSASTEASSQTCANTEEFMGMSICVTDIAYRSANKTKIAEDDSSGSTSTTATPTTDKSSKLMTSVVVILSVCGVGIVVVGSMIIRKRRRMTSSYSGDTRASSFYENSDVLLSPSKLEPKAEEVPAANATPGGVADLDLGREVIHLGKKLGIHGLRKGEYKDKPVVALRVSLRALHISMREVNKLIASYIPFRHRNIVDLIGTSMTALEDLLIVVEYMGKGSLRSVLRNPKIDLTWQDRLRMSTDVCTAIDFIHSTRPNLVSKNLTSKSILCNNELVCKLDIFDYGRKVRDHIVPVLNFGQCEIATRAPEVLAGGAVTRAAEVYALGVVFCEISLRQMPFEDIINDMGPTLGDLYIAREVSAQRLQLKPAEDAPSEFQELATRCLSFDPTGRPTVSDILKLLRA